MMGMTPAKQGQIKWLSGGRYNEGEAVMAGRRRDFDGQFAMSEIGFWFGDPRVRGKGLAVKVMAHFGWMVAVKERRGTLPLYWSKYAIGHAAEVRDRRTVEKCALCLMETSLWGEMPDGRIIIYGVWDKHPNLKWKDESIKPFIAPYKRPQSESESESESESSQLPDPDQKTTQKNKTKTLSQIDNDRQIEAFQRTWLVVIRKPISSDQKNIYPLAQKMIQRAEQIDINPNWIIGKCARADNPVGYYMAITKPGDSQARPDESGQGFNHWLEEITRGNRAILRTGHPVSIGSVINSLP